MWGPKKSLLKVNLNRADKFGSKKLNRVEFKRISRIYATQQSHSSHTAATQQSHSSHAAVTQQPHSSHTVTQQPYSSHTAVTQQSHSSSSHTAHTAVTQQSHSRFEEYAQLGRMISAIGQLGLWIVGAERPLRSGDHPALPDLTECAHILPSQQFILIFAK